MKTTNIHAAKTGLSKLIDAALRGEDVVIAKAGKPVVRQTPLAPDHARGERRTYFGCLKGQFAFETAELDKAPAEIEALFNEGPLFPADEPQ